MTSKAVILYKYEKSCNNSDSAQINFDHLDIFHYIYSVNAVAASDLYERYTASKQTIRSRIRVLEQCKLIKQRKGMNLGGNTNSNVYRCTLRGTKIAQNWPFRSSIPKIHTLVSQMPIVDRESIINLAQLATLISLSDLGRGPPYMSDIIDLLHFESESTIHRRIQYLKRKKLVVVHTQDNRRLGLSSQLQYTDFGQKISRLLTISHLKTI